MTIGLTNSDREHIQTVPRLGKIRHDEVAPVIRGDGGTAIQHEVVATGDVVIRAVEGVEVVPGGWGIVEGRFALATGWAGQGTGDADEGGVWRWVAAVGRGGSSAGCEGIVDLVKFDLGGEEGSFGRTNASASKTGPRDGRGAAEASRADTGEALGLGTVVTDGGCLEFCQGGRWGGPTTCGTLLGPVVESGPCGGNVVGGEGAGSGRTTEESRRRCGRLEGSFL